MFLDGCGSLEGALGLDVINFVESNVASNRFVAKMAIIGSIIKQGGRGKYTNKPPGVHHQ